MPDCIDTATEPVRSGRTSASEAPRPISGRGDAMPMLAGPTMRSPLRRALVISSSRSIPERRSITVVMTAPRTRLAMQSSTVAGTSAAGTAITARPTSSGIAASEGEVATPSISDRFGLTAYTGHSATAVTFFHSSLPTVPGRSDAPTTATDVGRSSRAIARESARCSRRSTVSMYSSVSSIGKSTSITPESKRRCSGQPALANTASMLRLSLSVCAVNRAMPLWRPTAARCSSNSVAMPRPW